jgi:hypothetical protein
MACGTDVGMRIALHQGLPLQGDAMPQDKQHGHMMDSELVSGQPHELEYLARTHGTSVEQVKAVIDELGTRSRARIEEALDKRFQHRSLAKDAPSGERKSGADSSERGAKPRNRLDR